MIIRHDDIIIDYAGYGLETPRKTPTLTSYLVDKIADSYYTKRAAVVVCPGGGYVNRADYEGEPVALKFCAEGMHAFVLNYSVAPARFPASLLELSAAVAMVRGFAKEYNIDTDKIVVCGFSAGGHLAASLGVYWHEGFIQRFLGYDNNENQPNGMILCYPVITNKTGVAHLGSIQNLLGKYPDEKELALFSLEDNVNDYVPPTFIWHTYDDTCVPVGNTLCFVDALNKYNIPAEVHIYPKGDHGLGLAAKKVVRGVGQIVPSCQNWIDMAIRFVDDL